MVQQILLFTALLLFQLGQLGRISFLNQNVNIYAYEIVMCLFILSLLLRYRFTPLQNLWKRDKSFFLFFLVILISFVSKIPYFSIGENGVGFAYTLRLFTYSVFGIYTYFYIKNDKGAFKRLDIWIPFFCVGFIITSLLQYFYYPDLRNLLYSGWDPHLYRLFGVFFDSSISASIYGIFATFFLIHSFKNKVITKYKLLFLLIFLALLMLTYSRDMIISLFITILIYFVRNKKVIFVLFLFLFILFVYVIAPKSWGEGVNLKRTVSIQSRIIDYATGLEMWKKAPFLGIGYNRLRYERQHLSTAVTGDSSHAGASFHSSYLIILVTSGLFGLLSLFFIQYSLYTKIIASSYYVILISIASLGDNIMLHPFILFILGILISLTQMKKKKISHL